MSIQQKEADRSITTFTGFAPAAGGMKECRTSQAAPTRGGISRGGRLGDASGTPGKPNDMMQQERGRERAEVESKKDKYDGALLGRGELRVSNRTRPQLQDTSPKGSEFPFLRYRGMVFVPMRTECVDCDRTAIAFHGRHAYCRRCLTKALIQDPDAHKCPACGEKQPAQVLWEGRPCGKCRERKRT